jgi:hypothetical protein
LSRSIYPAKERIATDLSLNKVLKFTFTSNKYGDETIESQVIKADETEVRLFVLSRKVHKNTALNMNLL